MNIDLIGDLGRLKESLVVLRKTKEITPTDKALPEWAALSSFYKQVENDPIGRSVVSILNAIIYQQRIMFVLTRKSLANLVRTDLNFSRSAKFSNKNYRAVIKLLIKYVTCEREGTGRSPSLYRVTHPEILRYLPRELADHQSAEANAFIDQASLDQKLDHKVDQVGSREQEATRIQEQVPEPDPVKVETPERYERYNDQIERMERLLNCPGVPERTKAMLNAWRTNEMRFKTGLSEKKLKILQDIEERLSVQQKRDMMTDRENTELNALEELADLIREIGVANLDALRKEYISRHGQSQLQELTRARTFTESVSYMCTVYKLGTNAVGSTTRSPHNASDGSQLPRLEEIRPDPSNIRPTDSAKARVAELLKNHKKVPSSRFPF